MSMFINLCVLILLFIVEISTHTTYTWREAYDKCKDKNRYLKSDINANEFGPSKRFNMSVWIGSVQFLSKWLEIQGCYRIDDPTTGNIFNVKTIANCEIECQGFEFFAYQTGEYPVCKCMSKLPPNTLNAKNCDGSTYTHLIVYKRYSNSESYETEKENCMYMVCTPGNPNNEIKGPFVVSCSSNKAHGVCEKQLENKYQGTLNMEIENRTSRDVINMPCLEFLERCRFKSGNKENYEDISNWNLGWNGSLKKCISDYGTYFLDDFNSGCSHVLSKTWTRVFRKQRLFLYDIHSVKDVLNDHQLIKCAAKRWNVTNNSWNKDYIDCDSTLPFYFCKKDPVTYAPQASVSTVKAEKELTTEIGRHSSKSFLKSSILPVWMTQAINQLNGVTKATLTSGLIQSTDSSLFNIGHKSEHEDKQLDVIIGTVVGGLTVVVGVSILLVVCKVRSSGIFSKKEDHSIIEFSKETCERSDQSTPMKMQPHVGNKRNGPEIQKTKDTYAQVIKPHKTKNNMLYSEVNKTRKLSPGIQETNDDYSEFSEGEYDRLNNFDRRILNKDSNMYDSNVGIRNCKDPMYDTTLHANRLEGEDVYDHSFTNVDTDSNYDCSSSLAQKSMKDNDVYDKSV